MQRTSENMSVVQGFFSNLEGRKRDALLAAFDDNGWWDTPSGGPFTGRFVGKAGLARLTDLLAASRAEGPIVTDLTLHADNDRVFAEFTWAPIAGTTPRAPTRSLAVFEVVFGKISAVREFESGPPALTRAG